MTYRPRLLLLWAALALTAAFLWASAEEFAMACRIVWFVVTGDVTVEWK